jgi:hypothetical protein
MKIQTEKSFKGFLYDLSMINLFWDMYPEVRSEIMRDPEFRDPGPVFGPENPGINDLQSRDFRDWHRY